MRSILVATVLTTVIYQARSADDRAAIQAVLDVHGAAWTAGNAAAAAAVMTDDADWLRGNGTMVRGRSAIEAMHRDMFAGGAKNTRHVHPGTPDIRFVRPDVAIVDGDSYVGPMDSQPTPDKLSRYTAVFVKERGEWKVTAFRSVPSSFPRP